jgi:hypothetical protein
MLAGKRPFDAESPLEALTQRLTQSPPPLASAAPGVDDDLAEAVMRCLEREPANRWPDARALRAATALIDDGEDPLPIRLVRFSVTMAVFVLFGAVYFGIFQGPGAAIGASIGFVIPLAVIGTGAFVVAKRQKPTTRSIGRLALLQPRAWRFWYPKRFRRRGDVWDRLPMRVRQLRIQMTVAFLLMVGIAVPTQLGLIATGGSPAARIAVAIVILVCLTFIVVTRSRMTKYVSRSLGMTTMEASRVLSLKSWQTAAWQSGAASMLLRRDGSGQSSRASSDGTPTVTAPVEHPTNEVTRL